MSLHWRGMTKRIAALVTGPITASGLTVASNRILGRVTAGTGAVEELVPGFGSLPQRNVTQKTASFTAVAWNLYSISLAAAADIAVTFPAAPAVGDRFGYRVEVAHATHSYKVLPVSGTSCCGITTDAVNGKWWLFIAGEQIIWEYDGATWWPVVDGRIGTVCIQYKSTNQTGEAAGTWTRVQADTVVRDNCHASTIGASAAITVRRPGMYMVSGGCYSADLVNGYYGVAVAINDAPSAGNIVVVVVQNATLLIATALSLAASNAISLSFISQQGSRGYTGGSVANSLSVCEML